MHPKSRREIEIVISSSDFGWQCETNSPEALGPVSWHSAGGGEASAELLCLCVCARALKCPLLHKTSP
jgi:hypothetical protein